MIFNKGFICPNCGPIQAAKKSTKNKIQHNTCPDCTSIVKDWERPLNERAGRCNNCAGASFTMKIKTRQLMRVCKRCDEMVNTDNNCEIVRKGDKTHEYN